MEPGGASYLLGGCPAHFAPGLENSLLRYTEATGFTAVAAHNISGVNVSSYRNGRFVGSCVAAGSLAVGNSGNENSTVLLLAGALSASGLLRLPTRLSTNGGETWRFISSDPFVSWTVFGAYATSEGLIVLGLPAPAPFNETVRLTMQAAFSSDLGETWTIRSAPPTAPSFGCTWCEGLPKSVHLSAPSDGIFIGTAQQQWWLAANGSTWTLLAECMAPFWEGAPAPARLLTLDGSTILALTSAADYSVVIRSSSDLGVSWYTVGEWPPFAGYVSVSTFAIPLLAGGVFFFGTSFAFGSLNSFGFNGTLQGQAVRSSWPPALNGTVSWDYSDYPIFTDSGPQYSITLKMRPAPSCGNLAFRITADTGTDCLGRANVSHVFVERFSDQVSVLLDFQNCTTCLGTVLSVEAYLTPSAATRYPEVNYQLPSPVTSLFNPPDATGSDSASQCNAGVDTNTMIMVTVAVLAVFVVCGLALSLIKRRSSQSNSREFDQSHQMLEAPRGAAN
ncbi:hypothetical protein AB1Y20_015337 [Prymnesium parvum]|uniref:Reelin n=1 Tax=Prymnesium parvum TaxID=97485 RepID=A0AB34K061_PRYPA